MYERPSTDSLSYIGVGLMFLFVGLAAVTMSGHLPGLTCTRSESATMTCVRTSKLFGLIPLYKELLSPIQGAYSNKSCHTGGDTGNITECAYGIVVETAVGRERFIIPFAGGEDGGGSKGGSN